MLSCLLLFIFKHFSNNLFWWRHVFIKSDFLCNNWMSLSAFIMNTFSDKHNLQKLIFVLENTFATTFHITMGAIFASFNCHIYFDNSVLFRYFLWVNSFLWFLKCSLRGISETPRQNFFSSLVLFRTSAW